MNTPTPNSQTSAVSQLTFEEILDQHVPQRFDIATGKMRCACGESFPADSDRFDNEGYFDGLMFEADMEHHAHVTQIVGEHFPISNLDRAAIAYLMHVPVDPAYSDEYISRVLRGRVNTR